MITVGMKSVMVAIYQSLQSLPSLPGTWSGPKKWSTVELSWGLPFASENILNPVQLIRIVCYVSVRVIFNRFLRWPRELFVVSTLAFACKTQNENVCFVK